MHKEGQKRVFAKIRINMCAMPLSIVSPLGEGGSKQEEEEEDDDEI